MEGIKNYIFDRDGVLVLGSTPIPGVKKLIGRMIDENINFAILTNNPFYTPKDLKYRLAHVGLNVPEKCIYTSAMATAAFLNSQRPGGSAYVIGESGLTTAIHNVGYAITQFNPDYVVLGETTNLSFQNISTACSLIDKGARFICTNPDTVGPVEDGIVPAAGSLAALISKTTGVEPYFIGKPNPLMMRSVLRYINAHSEETAMIGDQMDTDIKAGMEAGIKTVLVLSGLMDEAALNKYPFRPDIVVNSVTELDI